MQLYLILHSLNEKIHRFEPRDSETKVYCVAGPRRAERSGAVAQDYDMQET